MARTKPIVWRRVRGRSGYDAPSELPNDMAAEVLNVRFRRGSIGQKRFGATSRTFTGSSFSGFNALAEFVPGQNPSAAEFHWVSRDATPKILRVAAGTAAAELTLTDAISGVPQNATSATLNGKLYWAYQSAVNRLHVYDPALSTTTVRRVGLKAPAAPTAADTAAGGGYQGGVTRLYRARWLLLDGGRVKLKSDSTAYVSFTTSGGHSGVDVTRPTAAGEGETHWQLEGSPDGGSNWYIISGFATIATTVITDTIEPSLYADQVLADEIGANLPPPGAKFVISTGSRLMMFGAYGTTAGDSLTPYAGRLWWSPVLGTSTTSSDDDERVSNTATVKGYLDLSRNAGVEERALVGPVLGAQFAFLSRGIYMIVPTNNPDRPYRQVQLSTELGAVSHESTYIGEDEKGRPCIYFVDPDRGPYRYGVEGFQWLGYDLQDLWPSVNLAASNRVAHGCWNAPKRIAHFWVATGSANDPDLGLPFHVREGQPTTTEGVRYGWGRDTGDAVTGRCSVMFASTFGATMSRNRSVYVGLSNKLLKTEDTSATDDAGTTFQAYVISKAWPLEPEEAVKTVTDAWIRGVRSAGVTIRQTLIRNFGDEASRTVDQTLDGLEGSTPTRVLKRFDDTALADVYTFQVQLGDVSAVSNAWLLDQYTALVRFERATRGNNL